MKAVKTGDPMDPATDMGPLSSEEQRDTVLGQLARFRDAGAKLLFGAEKPDLPGAYLTPGVLVDVDPESDVAKEEVFGPVAMVFKVADIDEAIALANDVPFGLGSSIWTKDADEQERFARDIAAGMTAINRMLCLDPRSAVRRGQTIGPRPRAGAVGIARIHEPEGGDRLIRSPAKAGAQPMNKRARQRATRSRAFCYQRTGPRPSPGDVLDGPPVGRAMTGTAAQKYPLLATPHVRLHGTVDDAMYDRFCDQLAACPADGMLVVTITTLGGDPEVARAMGDDIRLIREFQGRDILFLGKVAVYSAGATFMSAFPVEHRFLTHGTRLLLHERQITKTIELNGPLRMVVASLQAALNESRDIGRDRGGRVPRLGQGQPGIVRRAAQKGAEPTGISRPRKRATAGWCST